jgi:pSer/pThr/pTyr-binding forkhead associated (FHA) protein
VSDDATLDGDETVSASIDVARLALSANGHFLRMVEGPGAPRLLPIQEDRYVVGRSLEASIHVPSGLLSREHMELVRLEGEIRAEDLGSRNGVYLNGLRIHAVILRNGDVIQCGDVVFEYQEGI